MRICSMKWAHACRERWYFHESIDVVGSRSAICIPASIGSVGDRIEAGTYLTAGALSGGPTHGRRHRYAEFLRTVLMKFEEMGANILTTEDSIDGLAYGTASVRPTSKLCLTLGFPPTCKRNSRCWLRSLMAVRWFLRTSSRTASCSLPSSIVWARIFALMDIMRSSMAFRVCKVHPLLRLTCAVVQRSLIAGLAAEGETRIYDIHHIDRGYRRLRG